MSEYTEQEINEARAELLGRLDQIKGELDKLKAIDSVTNPKPKGPKPKTFQEWQSYRRSQGERAYYSSKTQQRIARDRDTLGADAFFSKSED